MRGGISYITMGTSHICHAKLGLRGIFNVARLLFTKSKAVGTWFW